MAGLSYEAVQTGATETARETATEPKRVARTATAAKRPTRQTRKAPPTAPVADELPIAGYDELTVDDIGGKLAELSQAELAEVGAYERKHDNRSTVVNRVSALQGDEPWPGYDGLTVDEVRAALAEDDEHAGAVRVYERAHKNRAGVLAAVERELASA